MIKVMWMSLYICLFAVAVDVAVGNPVAVNKEVAEDDVSNVAKVRNSRQAG